MSSLDAMKRGIENQPRDLLKYCDELQRQRSEYPPLDPAKTIFTGSGDSYSVAFFASELSNGMSQALDPYELSKKPWLARRKQIIIISVSGKTKTNIELAKKLRHRARAVVAVTSDPLSPLALKCHHTLLLSYQRESVPTAGTSSYSSSLLGCSFLLGKLPKIVDLAKALALAWVWSKRTATRPLPTAVTIIGSGLDYAVGYYGALKLNEVLGLPATCKSPEEFGHAYLFSVKKMDAIICMNPDQDRKTQAVLQVLRTSDFTPLKMQSQSADPLLRGFELAFRFQCLAYVLARRKDLKECAYISDKKRLAISSRMIY
jgi:fructoselysine-6-P-deglycase FrlB-like protein